MNYQKCPQCRSLELPTSLFCSQCAAKINSAPFSETNKLLKTPNIYKPLTIGLCIIALFVFMVAVNIALKPTQATVQTAGKIIPPTANTTPTIELKSSFSSSSAELQGENKNAANQFESLPISASKLLDTSKIYGNKKSLIYHWSGCPGFSEISPKNRVVFDTVDEAESKGYAPASNCSTPQPTTESEQIEIEAYSSEPNTDSTPAPLYVTPITPTPTPVVRAETIPETTPYYPAPRNDSSVSERTYQEPSSPASAPTAICKDGTYSYSQNNSGTCSHHGGVSVWLSSTPRTPSFSDSPSTTYKTPDTDYRPKTVYVRGYTRKDGTYVAPHTRRAPRRK